VAAPQLTTSHLPGTTLGFVKTAQLGGRHALYDTPGLVLPNQLTTRLTADELAAVVPKRRGQPVSLRLEEGRSLLLGGLARLDLVAGRPFLFTAYLSDAVTLHPTATAKAAEVRRTTPLTLRTRTPLTHVLRGLRLQCSGRRAWRWRFARAPREEEVLEEVLQACGGAHRASPGLTRCGASTRAASSRRPPLSNASRRSASSRRSTSSASRAYL